MRNPRALKLRESEGCYTCTLKNIISEVLLVLAVSR
jgi:hypothetical protein